MLNNHNCCYGIAIWQYPLAKNPVSKLDDGSHMDLKKEFKSERWLDEKTC
jgi:hypothetical protein